VASSAGHLRPGRYLAFFALIVIVLYALVFLTGNHKPTPKLGIDLQGGTRVTLTARTVDGRPPSRESLDQARQIIEQRVNGIGVSGAEVVLDGVNLIITVPGENGDQAKTLGQTAKLYFRPVISEEPAGTPAPAPGGKPTGGSGPTEPSGSSQTPGAPAPVAPQQVQQPPPGEPTPTPTPTPTPKPAAPSVGNVPAESANPAVAEQIRQARARLQSTDPAVQQQALATLNCTGSNPLRGNDDPNLPLVTCDQHSTAKYLLGPAFLSGEQIANASSGPRSDGPGYEVRLDLKTQGEDIWGQYTAANIGKQAAFVLDTEVVSAPQITAAISPGEQTRITGSFTQAEAKNLADVLKYGSLPLSFESSEAETVSATLGLTSLRAGLIAGAIGLALVFIYALLYYRLLGLVMIASLILSAVVVYACLVLLGRQIGFTLSLAGIAGFIVAIGITADSFVIFFERIRDEMREGKSMRVAVETGWVRAKKTRLAANVVSLLSAAVLYLFATGVVKGFGFALGLSTLIDLAVLFWFTKPLVSWFARFRFFNAGGKLSGLSPETLGTDAPVAVGGKA